MVTAESQRADTVRCWGQCEEESGALPRRQRSALKSLSSSLCNVGPLIFLRTVGLFGCDILNRDRSWIGLKLHTIGKCACEERVSHGRGATLHALAPPQSFTTHHLSSCSPFLPHKEQESRCRPSHQPASHRWHTRSSSCIQPSTQPPCAWPPPRLLKLIIFHPYHCRRDPPLAPLDVSRTIAEVALSLATTHAASQNLSIVGLYEAPELISDRAPSPQASKLAEKVATLANKDALLLLVNNATLLSGSDSSLSGYTVAANAGGRGAEAKPKGLQRCPSGTIGRCGKGEGVGWRSEEGQRLGEDC